MPQIAPKYVADIALVDAAKWILTGYFFKLYVANNLNKMTAYMNYPVYQTLQTAGPLAAGGALQLSDLR